MFLSMNLNKSEDNNADQCILSFNLDDNYSKILIITQTYLANGRYDKLLVLRHPRYEVKWVIERITVCLMPNASIKLGVNAVFLRFIAQLTKDICNINDSLRDTPTGMQ